MHVNSKPSTSITGSQVIHQRTQLRHSSTVARRQATCKASTCVTCTYSNVIAQGSRHHAEACELLAVSSAATNSDGSCNETMRAHPYPAMSCAVQSTSHKIMSHDSCAVQWARLTIMDSCAGCVA